MHFYSWKAGLKTGMYYLRTRPKTDAIQFTVDQLALAEARSTTAIVGGDFAQGKPMMAMGGGGAQYAAAAAAGGGTAVPMGGTPGAKTTPVFGAPVLSLESSGSDNDSADSSARQSPLMFTTPVAKRSSGGGGGSSGHEAELPAGSSPGAAAPEPVKLRTAAEREAELEAKAKAAAEERQRARANLEMLGDQSEVCLNCGS